MRRQKHQETRRDFKAKRSERELSRLRKNQRSGRTTRSHSQADHHQARSWKGNSSPSSPLRVQSFKTIEQVFIGNFIVVALITIDRISNRQSWQMPSEKRSFSSEHRYVGMFGSILLLVLVRIDSASFDLPPGQSINRNRKVSNVRNS